MYVGHSFDRYITDLISKEIGLNVEVDEQSEEDEGVQKCPENQGGRNPLAREYQ